jgi:BirA family biotin operon repressor/biotin-[acetyl-CoA-carboxylase] ligase
VVVVTDHQRAGRGRLDRAWHAPPASSLLMSILLRPGLETTESHLASTAVACAAVDACASVAGVQPVLKWPNDLLIVADGRVRGKVAGILAESVIERGRLTAIVVGLGLNVNWPPALPDELVGIAVALNHVVGREVDREDLLIELLGRLGVWRTCLDDVSGRSKLVHRYRELCGTIGATVRVDLSGESFRGVAVDITSKGHLVVETAAGMRREVVAGDVVHVRSD